MRYGSTRSFVAAFVLLSVAACGGGGGDGGQETTRSEETGAQPAAESTAGDRATPTEMTMPDWIQVDRTASTATLEVVAGKTDANNSWNFNGYADGEVVVVVPVDYEITVDFRNADQVVAHSLGIDEKRTSWPATFDDPQPVFEGAMTESPTSMSGATQPGESETLVFTADEAGEYTMVCYIPGHANQGMWIYFTVSAEGEAGLRQVQS